MFCQDCQDLACLGKVYQVSFHWLLNVFFLPIQRAVKTLRKRNLASPVVKRVKSKETG